MATIGEYEYPTLSSFKDAIDLANAALEGGGVIANTKAASTLGYKVREDGNLPGPVYQRFDDLCRFGLLERDKGKKGIMRLTSLGEEAVNKDEFQKADAAKIKAIRSIQIIAKAFDSWNGNVPDNNALQGKLHTLTGVDYNDCKNHVAPLSRLFQETFPILKTLSGEITKPLALNDARGEGMLQDSTFERREIGKMGRNLGELRTKIGTVILTNKATIDLAIKHLEVLKEQVEEESKNVQTGGEGTSE